MIGAMDERGRLRPCTALASGPPLSSAGRNEKSVSWLLRTNPPTVRPDPNTDSTVVVIDTTLPAASMMTKWLVPSDSTVASLPRAPGSRPGAGGGPACSPINPARARR